MSEPTYTVNRIPALRDDAPADQAHPSHRSTTSSRLPGVTLEGTVWTRRAPVAPCVDCKEPRRDLGGPHAPHFLNGVLVDCQMRPIGGAR